MSKVNKIQIKLQNVQLSFANLFTPKSFQDSKPAYSANFLISKTDTKTVLEIKEAIMNLIKTQWPDGSVKLKADKIAFKDGDEVTYSGYADHMYLTAKNYLKPQLKDLSLADVTEGDGVLNSGDIVNAVVELWVQDNNYGKRINCNLVAVQYVKKGKSFSNPVNAPLFSKSEAAITQEEVNNIF